jgi:Cytochrome P450
MLRARDDWGEGMLERHLRDEVMTLYLAGHTTTADLLAWVFYALARWPEVESALYTELEAVLGDREPSLEDLERLTITNLIVDETLRMYPGSIRHQGRTPGGHRRWLPRARGGHGAAESVRYAAPPRDLAGAGSI